MVGERQVGVVRMSHEADVVEATDPSTEHKAKRVLVTGLSTYWGGRLAQALESHPEIEAIIGVDNHDPTRELERTEFVKVSNQHSLIQRIVIAAEIDTVIDTRLVVNSIQTAPNLAHENNVIGTMNILAACAGADSPVRKFIFKSSAHYYGCEQDDPAFFTEDMKRPAPAAHAHRARHRRGRDRRRRVRRPKPAPDDHGAALRQRARARTSAPPTPACSRCRSSRWCSASTRAASSSTRTTSSTRSSTPPSTRSRASSTSAATGSSPSRR